MSNLIYFLKNREIGKRTNPNYLNEIKKELEEERRRQIYDDDDVYNQMIRQQGNLGNLIIGRGRKISPWITYVKKIQKKYKCSYKEALSIASKSYHKK